MALVSRVAFVASLMLPLCNAVSNMAWAEDASGGARKPVLAVEGVGSTEKKPDTASFSAVFETEASTLQAAATAHEDRLGQVQAAVAKAGNDGLTLQKTSFALRENRPYSRQNDNRRPPPPTFTATTTFEFRTDQLDRLTPAITALANTGLLRINSIRFDVKNRRAVLNEARRAAVLDAREQADVYADAAGLRLVEITDIADGNARPSDLGEADLPMPRNVMILPPATLRFDATVQIKWRIAPK